MAVVKIIWNCIEIIAFIYLGLASVYVLFFSFCGIFHLHHKIYPDPKRRKIAVLIPGYKEDSVIVEVATTSLGQTYPAESYDIVVIADSFQPETIAELKQLPIKVIEVSFEKSTKSKALNAAMEALGDDYDIVVVLDADNIMNPDFLEQINMAFEAGYEAVQGHRIAKNMNNSMAILDAVSEEINNHIFRKGHRIAGLSSALIGSGMAFNYQTFKKRMSEIRAIGGFDKELELTMLRDRIKIEYLENAIILDEKVQKADVFENQRRRWLSAQFFYFRRFAWDGCTQLLSKRNLDYIDKVYQMIQPPRILLLGVLTIIALVVSIITWINQAWTGSFLCIDFYYWLILWLMTVMAFLFAIPRKFYNKQTLLALLTLPIGFWLMLRSLFRLRGANKTFIHTQHGVNKPNE